MKYFNLMDIALKIEGENGLKDRHVSKDNSFKHKTSNEINILPYTTKWSAVYYNDFVYFSGIMGECFRLANNKKLSKELRSEQDYNAALKKIIINESSKNVSTANKAKLKELIEDLIFQEKNLFCFSKKTLPYLSFKTDNATLRGIGAFIFDVFFDEEVVKIATQSSSRNSNILYRLIELSLPKLEPLKPDKKEYLVFNDDIIKLFKKDFLLLSSSEDNFLKDIDKLLKYYYFYYVSQLSVYLNSFFSDRNYEAYFTLESEVVSKSRHAYHRGWQQLEGNIVNLFAHANTLELLNYIRLGKRKPNTYKTFEKLYHELQEDQKKEVIGAITELEIYYKEIISKPNVGWQECKNQLEQNLKYKELGCEFEKAVFKFWFTVDFQFQYTARKKPYHDYSLWFSEFCKANFLKRRGRIGYTLRLTQEMLLFLTKLCIGKEAKIRLKVLWKELEKRGVYFDEPSKEEVVRLFEKINLIEKKSDSGDAQYVRAIL